MFDNKPFEEIEKQAKHVIDLLNQEGARKQAIRLKVTLPDAPLPQTLPSLVAARICPLGSCLRPMRRVSRWA